MELNKEEFINAKTRFYVPPRSVKPPIDELISKIVGKDILARDPRLIHLIVKWKAGKSQDSNQPDNYLTNPEFIKELKQTFNA